MQSDRETYHSPLRLLIVIQAPTKYIEHLLNNDFTFREKVQNGWVRLASVDPEGRWKTGNNHEKGVLYMNAKKKKVLLLTDMEHGIEPIIQQVTNIQRENMLTIHSCDSVIVHPFGDIMRSIIIAIYQENVEEIFVVGIEDKNRCS